MYAENLTTAFAAQFEAQAGLPDVLTLASGQPVQSWEEWRQQRRPELIQLIQQCEYGFLPPPPPQIFARLLHEDAHAYGGVARLREMEISWGAPGFAFHLLLVTPAISGPVPVFLGMNFSGNHGLTPDPEVGPPPGWKFKGFSEADASQRLEATRGQSASTWDIEATVRAGFGVATLYLSDIIPDNSHAFERLAEFRAATGAPDVPGAQCATIGAWAWVLMRVVDFLVTDETVDASALIAVGHSRLGKTALLAGALDERIAIVIPSQSGCGGAAPARAGGGRDWGGVPGGAEAEGVEQINQGFPYWFCANFKSFGNQPERLPFEQDALLALCAPRPLLVSNGSEDSWANPAGQFVLLESAARVYELAGQGGLEVTKMPAEGEFSLGRAGYFLRPGKHSMTPQEWEVWRPYAKRWLRRAR